MGSLASEERSWEVSASLMALPLPAASLQNDLNQGGPGSTNSKKQASWSLEAEKSRLLAEAALELREENTRQERILALAKRLAVLRGQDPERGEGWGAAAHWCPLVKASLAGLSQVLGVFVSRDLLSPAQSHKEGGGAKQWVRRSQGQPRGQGTFSPFRG